MEFREFGREEQPVVVLLDQRGLTNWQAEAQVAVLQEKYHILLPVLAENMTDLEAAEQAEGIADYINRCYNGSAYALCSLAGSWAVTKKLLAVDELQYHKIIIESTSLLPGQVVAAMMR